MKIDIGHNLLRINSLPSAGQALAAARFRAVLIHCGSRQSPESDQPIPVYVPGSLSPRQRPRIGRPERKRISLERKNQPSAPGITAACALSAARCFRRQFVNEFLLRLRQRVAREGSWDSQTAKDSGVKTQIAEAG
jgi:hypothetical protein